MIDEQSQNIERIKWIIVGAETGNKKDKIKPKKRWIDKIVKFANRNEIPVFMKDSLIDVVGEENILRDFPKQLKE